MPVASGIYYEWFGDETSPPIILSPGLGGSAHYWEPNLLALAADYRVLVYDHRGIGRSDLSVENVSIGAMAQDMIGLINALGIDEPLGFIGHAIGGMIGLEVAMQAPELLMRVMVVNGWSSLDPHTARCFDVREALLHVSPQAYIKAQPLFLYTPAYISEHDHELFRWESEALDTFPMGETILTRIHAARMWDPGPARLGTITIPVMCLATEDDALVPAACSEKLANLIPKAKLASMSWGGHAVNVTRPADFDLRVMDFLR